MYLILLILWFIFSGKVTLEIFLFGLVICGWLYWFMTKHMDYSIQNDLKLIAKIPRFIKYGIILVWEVIKSNLAVIRIILSPGLEADPTFYTFETDLKTEDMYYNQQKRSEVKEEARRLRRKFLRYQQAEIVYSLSHKKLMELANDAGAIYRMDGIVLINREIFDEYLEQFHEK